MRSFRFALATTVLLLNVIHCFDPAPLAQARYPLTNEDVDQWMAELSNWGRWGADDQLGALNLITAEKRKQAAALVEDGFSVSLSRDADTEQSIYNPYSL